MGQGQGEKADAVSTLNTGAQLDHVVVTTACLIVTVFAVFVLLLAAADLSGVGTAWRRQWLRQRNHCNKAVVVMRTRFTSPSRGGGGGSACCAAESRQAPEEQPTTQTAASATHSAINHDANSTISGDLHFSDSTFV